VFSESMVGDLQRHPFVTFVSGGGRSASTAGVKMWLAFIFCRIECLDGLFEFRILPSCPNDFILSFCPLAWQTLGTSASDARPVVSSPCQNSCCRSHSFLVALGVGTHNLLLKRKFSTGSACLA